MMPLRDGQNILCSLVFRTSQDQASSLMISHSHKMEFATLPWTSVFHLPSAEMWAHMSLEQWGSADFPIPMEATKLTTRDIKKVHRAGILPIHRTWHLTNHYKSKMATLHHWWQWGSSHWIWLKLSTFCCIITERMFAI